MKVKFIKKLNFNFFLKIIYPILILVIIGGTSVLTLFLYQDFYQTITHSEQVFILRAEVASASVNITLFDEVIKNLEEKINKPEIETEKVKNAFVPISTPSPTRPRID